MKKNQDKEYHCYSIKQRDFLNEKGMKIKKEVRHAKTRKIAFIYEKTPLLDKLLTQWTNQKADVGKRS